MRYQLISPNMSDKIHKTDSLNDGAKECYKELKISDSSANINNFTIMDVDSFETFKFITKDKIKAIHTTQTGSGEQSYSYKENVSLKDIDLNTHFESNDDKLKRLENIVNKLNTKIMLIENNLKIFIEKKQHTVPKKNDSKLSSETTKKHDTTSVTKTPKHSSQVITDKTPKKYDNPNKDKKYDNPNKDKKYDNPNKDKKHVTESVPKENHGVFVKSYKDAERAPAPMKPEKIIEKNLDRLAKYEKNKN